MLNPFADRPRCGDAQNPTAQGGLRLSPFVEADEGAACDMKVQRCLTKNPTEFTHFWVRIEFPPKKMENGEMDLSRTCFGCLVGF